jgi:chromosome segregation ATPase
MELLLISGALAVGVAALVLALTLRSRLDSVERSATASKRFEDDARRGHEAMHGELGDVRRLLEQTRRELDAARNELSELKAAAEVLPPPPPLPRTRSGRLEDLRQQLRAAHREGDDTEEP